MVEECREVVRRDMGEELQDVVDRQAAMTNVLVLFDEVHPVIDNIVSGLERYLFLPGDAGLLGVKTGEFLTRQDARLPQGAARHYLSLQAVAGKMRVCITRHHPEPEPPVPPNDDDVHIPWLGAPHELRLQAVGRVPELVERITLRALEVLGVPAETTYSWLLATGQYES